MCLCLKKSNALTPSWRPWKVRVEISGWAEVGAQGQGRGRRGEREGEKRREEKKKLWVHYIFFRTNFLVLNPHTYPPTSPILHTSYILGKKATSKTKAPPFFKGGGSVISFFPPLSLTRSFLVLQGVGGGRAKGDLLLIFFSSPGFFYIPWKVGA